MSRMIEFPNPIRIDRLTRVFRLNGVDVFVHWTVFLIAAFMVYATRRNPWVTLTAGASYLGLLLLHECGHMIAAHRRHTQVTCIELYPIFGFCRFEIPWSRFDYCIIAWGGVTAQLVVAVPFMSMGVSGGVHAVCAGQCDFGNPGRLQSGSCGVQPFAGNTARWVDGVAHRPRVHQTRKRPQQEESFFCRMALLLTIGLS